MAEGLRVPVRVRPGAARSSVGGRYGPDALVVAVSARAVDGAANRAVVDAVAAAFGVRRGDVAIVVGPASRSKVVQILGDPAILRGRLAALLDA
jgi:uncharacterized protein